ncbi:MAG: cystathionine gamma-synthase [Xanthomonadales bacterium]|nr:cystathionine gamma-synthase [Xanthomonadales bacterium]NIX14136.1 cystathionine gamma-synthase [Xanthomonadales bacterium]
MKKHTATQSVRAGVDCDKQHGSVMPPLFLSANYSFEGLGGKRRYDYSRSGNPTRDLLGETLAGMEGGHGCVVTGSGMSAVVLVTNLLEPNDVLFAPHDCYGGCHRAFSALARQGRFRIRFVDYSNLPAVRLACLEQKPKIIWVETPSNPLLRITDIAAVSKLAKECGALVAVDNTFLSPLLQRPLELGADIVVHSTTKYINGHSDVVGGAVVAADPDLHEELAWWANCLGTTASPFDCAQTTRGLRTLHARMRCHEENARAVGDLLAGHPTVRRVHYPGLASHPDHALARRQQAGFGAIVSFELAGGERQTRAFLESVSCFTLAESLGGVESLVCHPATMSHASMSEADRSAAGISPGLLRLSVGIEHGDDLVADLGRSLERAVRSRKPWLNLARTG